MNPELPKPMLDALSREATPAAHPSPDVLTTFVERSLSGGEKQQIIDHLARCAECRDVVFLASNAADEPVPEATDEDQRLAAVRRLRFSEAFAARPSAVEAMASEPLAEKPRRTRFPRLIWAVPVAAGVVVIAGILIQQRFVEGRTATQLASNASSKVYPPAPQPETPPISSQSSSVAVAAPLSVGKPAKAVRPKSVPSQRHDAIESPPQQPSVATERSALPTPAYANAFSDTGVSPMGGPVILPAPPTARAGALGSPVAGNVATHNRANSQLFSAPQVSNRAVNAPHAQWRITEDGHLEHSTPSGWTRVLADPPTIFRVVSVVGNDVWAGGNAGALFHSTDGGRNWKLVGLVSSAGAETSAIVAIVFDDPQQGTVITESGTRYHTVDGGMTWISP